MPDVPVRSPDGKTTTEVPAEHLQFWTDRGYTPIADDDFHQSIADDAAQPAPGGAPGALTAGVSSLASGLTAGGSDVLLRALTTKGTADYVAQQRAAHPLLSTITNVAGAIAPALLTDGASTAVEGGDAISSALANSPSGLLSRGGARIATLGENSGVLGRTIANTAQGAFEGAGQAGGAYLSQTALEDKPVSAEGFVGAMGNGAMFGGAAGGALSIGESALVRAKSLFPRSEVTREAAEQAERDASGGLSGLSDSSEVTEEALRNALRYNRAIRSAEDPAIAQQFEALKIAPEDLARPPRRAFAGDEPVTAGDRSTLDTLESMGKPRATVEDPIAAALHGTEPPAAAPDLAARTEAAQDAAVAAVDPQHAQMVDAANELAAARSDLESQLRGTQGRLGAGEDLAAVSDRPIPAAKAAKKIAELERAFPGSFEGDGAAAARHVPAADIDGENMDPAEFFARNAPVEARTAMRFAVHGEVPPWEAGAARAAEIDPAAARAAEQKRENAYQMMLWSKKIEAPSLAEVKAGIMEPGGFRPWEKPGPWWDKSAGGTDAISAALRKRVGEEGSLAADVGVIAPKISRLERAQMRAAEMLGADAPPAAAAHAAQMRAAIEEHAHQAAATSANTASDIDRAAAEARANAADLPKRSPAMGRGLPAEGGRSAIHDPSAAGRKLPSAEGERALSVSAHSADGALDNPMRGGQLQTPTAARGGTLDKLKSAADVLAVLHSMGVPGVANLKDVPVIGPILSLYLKARAASAVFRRLGGKTPATTEALVASKAAATRNRVQAAVTKMLDMAPTAARGARVVVPTTAGVLATKLFDGKTMQRVNDGPAPKNDDQREYQSRMHELIAAQQPGAIADAVRTKVPTGDAALQQAIVEAQTRKLSFLYDKAPKALQSPTLLSAGAPWRPSPSQLDTFARYIDAAENPAGVLEQLADHGRVTMEAAETLRTVYPTLYREAQVALLKAAPAMQATLPFSRRNSLSILFQVPVDGTMTPSYISFLRAGQPAPQVASGSQGATPPTPSISGAGVQQGSRTQTGLDRRSGA